MKSNAPNACSRQTRHTEPAGRTVRVHPVAVTIYLFCAALLYLAAAYLGGTYPYVVAVLAALPLTSLAHATLSFRGTWIEADVLSTPRVRGERLVVTATVGSSRRSPPALWKCPVWFIEPDYTGGAHTSAESPVESLDAVAGRGKDTSITRELLCRHRGDYEVVFGPLTTVDMLGWVSLSKAGIRRRVHVYPRVLRARQVLTGDGASSPARNRSRVPDYTLLRGLTRYREGLPVRHMAWKKFAAHGIPYLKEYEHGENEPVRLYLDSRLPIGPTRTHADVIDHTLETAVAALHAFLTAATPLKFTSPGLPHPLRGETLRDFDSIYRATRLLQFTGAAGSQSLVPTVEREVAPAGTDGGGTANTVIVVVSHLPDDRLLALPARAAAAGRTCRLVLCAYNWTLEQVAKAHAATSTAGAVQVVSTSDELLRGTEEQNQGNPAGEIGDGGLTAREPGPPAGDGGAGAGAPGPPAGDGGARV